ncbi:MAG: nucleoside 2-deoxyribosyltransferase [Miltoncostaeaceae bacterium]
MGTGSVKGRPRARCYVASPLGFTDAGRLWMGTVLLPALQARVEPVDPWSLGPAGEFAEAEAAGEAAYAALLDEVGRRNAAAIAGCDLLLAVLDGQEVDAGTAAEVGYAAGLGLPCLGLRTDLRVSGEPGAGVNLQVRWFIRAGGGAVATTLSELLGLLESPPAGAAPHR